MTEFSKLQAQLAEVKDLGELARASGLSRDHLRRIRDGLVSNTTLRTMEKIRACLPPRAAADQAEERAA